MVVVGLRNDCDRDNIPGFLLNKIKGLKEISVSTDLKPYLPGFAKRISLEFYTAEYAHQAKIELESRESSFNQSAFFNYQALCIFLPSILPLPFSLRISNRADETASSLAIKFKKFGSLNVPGLSSVKLSENNHSAKINFARFEDAKRALDAFQAGELILGNDSLVFNSIQPLFHTRLILRLINSTKLSGQDPCIPMSIATDTAQQVTESLFPFTTFTILIQVANECCTKPQRWLDAVRLLEIPLTRQYTSMTNAACPGQAVP